jgi:cell wall-associated NlpC family hydrolase
MSELGNEIIKAARLRVGAPFSHHFNPEDTCERGSVTIDACMEKGLSDNGYDCSGLAIASLSDVLGILPKHWPRELRHAKQLEVIAEAAIPETGDLLVYLPETMPNRTPGNHVGIFATATSVIHASGISGLVEEGEMSGTFRKTVTVPASILIELVNETR